MEDFCKTIKTNDDFKSIPIIFILNSGAQKDRIKSYQLGAMDYILEPFVKEELIFKLKMHLDLQKRYNSLKLDSIEQLEKKEKQLRLKNLELQQNNYEIKNLNEEYETINEELKQTNQQLFEAKEIADENVNKLNMMIENAPEGIFIQIDFKFAFVNQQTLNLFGATHKEQLIGTPIIGRFHKDYHQIATNRISEVNYTKKIQLRTCVENHSKSIEFEMCIANVVLKQFILF